MQKAILKVHRNTPRTRIEKVRVAFIQGNELRTDKYEDMTISDVISQIRVHRVNFITALVKGATWYPGQPIQIVSDGVTTYIRSVGNSRADDNLENLPEF